MKSNKPTWGGPRKGAGNKQKYGEPTSTISFRVPISSKDRIAKVVNRMLRQIIKQLK